MGSSTHESIGSSGADANGSEKDETNPSAIDPSRDLERASVPVSNNVEALGRTELDNVENPQNWPKLTRYSHVVPPALISFAA